MTTIKGLTRTILILIVINMIGLCFVRKVHAQSEIASGVDGNISWSINSDGVITFTGKGAMKEYVDGADLPWIDYMPEVTSAVVNEGITSLAPYTFATGQNLKNVSLPSTLTLIGLNAFWLCSSLEHVSIPDGVRTLPPGLFSNCRSLTEFNISAGVNYIAIDVFEYCTNLTKITVDANNSYYKAVDNVVFTKDGKKLVCCPPGKAGSYTVPQGVEEICAEAFYTCSKLTEINMFRPLNIIDYNAFYECTSLKTIQIPSSVKSFGSTVLEKCNNLKTIRGIKGSYAETYASLNGYQFESIPTIEDATVTLSQTEYTFNNDEKKPVPTVILEGKTLKDSLDYQVSYLNNVNAGSATVHIEGKGKYELSQDVTFLIEQKNLGDTNISLSKTSYDYNGTDRKPTVTVMDGKIKLIEDTHYKVSYLNNNDAGEGKVLIVSIGNYSGSVVLTFRINKITPSLTASNLKMVYGKKSAISATVSNSAELSYKSDDSSIAFVTANGKVAANGYGKAAITISSKETKNYNSAKTKITVTVVPAKMSYKSAKSKKKKYVTLKWKKNTTVTGYELRCGTSSSFNKANKKTTKDCKIGSLTLKGLTSKKKYYFWIRAYKTVSGKKYYGEWSKAKSVTIK